MVALCVSASASESAGIVGVKSRIGAIVGEIPADF